MSRFFTFFGRMSSFYYIHMVLAGFRDFYCYSIHLEKVLELLA